MISPLYGAIRSGEWADTAETLSKQNENNIKKQLLLCRTLRTLPSHPEVKNITTTFLTDCAGWPPLSSCGSISLKHTPPAMWTKSSTWLPGRRLLLHAVRLCHRLCLRQPLENDDDRGIHQAPPHTPAAHGGDRGRSSAHSSFISRAVPYGMCPRSRSSPCWSPPSSMSC